MLGPTERRGLTEALRPPPGYELEIAAGTTFTLDLEAVLTVPLAFVSHDVKLARSSGEEPIPLLDALSKTTDRVTVFGQAGYLSVPSLHRRIYTWLEDVIVPIQPPSGGQTFHPKVWAIRYSSASGGAPLLRLVCATRNLTFDTSWDTVLVTEAHQGVKAGAPNAGPLGDLLRKLAGRASPARGERIGHLADEVAALSFPAPHPFSSLHFAWLPKQRREDLLPLAVDRAVVMAPFVDPETLGWAKSWCSDLTLVSRPSTLDALGPKATESLTGVKVLHPAAELSEVPGDAEPTAEGVPARRMGRRVNLHAKLIVADHGDDTVVVTGSANATAKGWKRNDEVVAVMVGPRSCGVVDLLEGTRGRDRSADLSCLGDVLVDHVFDDAAAEDDGDEQRWLTGVRVDMSGLNLTGVVADEAEGVSLHVTSDKTVPRSGGASLTLRPLGTPPSEARPIVPGKLVDARWTVDLLDLSAFLVLAAAEAGSSDAQSVCLLKCELTGVPEDRNRRVLAALLGDGSRLIQFLLALLGTSSTSPAQTKLPGGIEPPPSSEGATRPATIEAPVLERLLGALYGRQEELETFAGLVEDLGEKAEEVLGPELHALWAVIDEVRRAG